MKRLLSALIVAAALAAPAFLTTQAHADARVVMCSPNEAGKAEGPRRVVNPNTSAAYLLNARGCAAMSSADVAWFASQGFTAGPNLFAIAKTGITAQDFTSLVLPPGAYVNQIIVRNTTANAVTGGVKVGTTAGGTDVVTALTCAANCLTFVADSALSKRVFSATASQTVSIDAVTGWNSASLDVTVFYSLF